jgi:hypothetical protein
MPVTLTKASLLFSLIICYLSSYSQTKVGAPNEAIGNATSTTSNLWSAWHNPAGISSHQQLSLGISYRTVQGLEGFNTASLAVALPAKIGAFGVGVSRFGDQLYNEQQVSLSYGSKFGITDLGIRLAYHQYHFEGFGNKGLPIISFGGITTITSEFFIGAFIENINQAKISDFQDERIPTIMQVGISYHPLESIALNVDIQKDVEFEATVLVGVSYAIIDNLTINTGFNTTPAKQFFGLDLKANNIKGKLSYAVANQRALGFSHQLSIQYDLKNKK